MTEPRKRPPGLAAIYARVSTERQTRSDKTSLDGQIRRYERVALDLGFTVNRDYVVKDPHSASNPEDRPKLEQLYTAPRSAFRYVLMDVVDRTTRAGVFDYLRSRLVHTKSVLRTPEDDIKHFAELIAACDEMDRRLADDLAEARRMQTSESFRRRVLEDARLNAESRRQYVIRLEAAQAEQRRRDDEEERLTAFAAKARAQAATLDYLTPEQRRELAVDLHVEVHVEVHVARHDNERRPRVFLMFSLTSEAATRARESDLWAAWTLHTADGDYVTYVEQGWPPVEPVRNAEGEQVFDFAAVPPAETSQLPSRNT